MFYINTTYLGIDPTAGVRPFTYVALDHGLQLLALGQGDLGDVLAFVAGQTAAFVAVCAPQSPNQGLMDRPEVREHLVPPPRPGRWRDFRVAEYLLRQHNIPVPRTPAEREACPGWMKQGFLFFQKLAELGYSVYPEAGTTRQYLEVYPHACFAVLLGRLPLPKHTLEGRLQRQLVLYEQKIHLPDPMMVFEEFTRHRLLQGMLPMDNLYQTEELDALAAAYVAWMAANKPEQITQLGDRREGQIVLPAATLRQRYT